MVPKVVINNKQIPFCDTTESGIEYFNGRVDYNVAKSPCSALFFLFPRNRKFLKKVVPINTGNLYINFF